MPSLWIVGHATNAVKVLARPTTIVARGLPDSSDGVLSLADRTVSEPIPGERQGHAAVTVESNACFVMDLGSTNGTHIVLDDDAMMRLAPGQRWRLTDGQMFVCGAAALVFRDLDGALEPEEIDRHQRRLMQVRQRAASSSPPPGHGLGGATAPIGRR